MEGCPGMTPISRRPAVNAEGSPILFNMNVSAADRLYYFYRYLRRLCRPLKVGWTDLQQNLWRHFHRQ